ncbi:TPA: hypothetical protein ACH3X1_006811 [Trebouxia sp. C0004]
MDWLSIARASAASRSGLLTRKRTALLQSSKSPGLTRRSTQRCKQRSLSRAATQRATQQQAFEQETRPKTAPKGACYGCGLDLQTVQPGAAGYVTPEKYATRLQHKQLNKLLCGRCQELSNGHMVPAVEDFSSRNLSGLQLAGKALISPDQLRNQLKGLAEQRILAVLVIDLLDCSGSFLSRVRDLVGRNPVLLIGTKVDLLPKGTDTAAVTEWLLATAGHRRLNVVNAHLVGNPAGQGISEVASAILRDRKGRSVYVLGAANVGKSSFIRALVREMSKGSSRCFQATAKAQSRRLPVESAMPGTTLQTIKLKAFVSGGALFDTPGVHLHHRLPHLLSPDELKELHPRKRLRPYYPPMPQDLIPQEEEDTTTGSTANAIDTTGPVSATYQWGGVARVDIVSAPCGTTLAFYGPPALHVHALPLVGQEELVQSAAALAAQSDSAQHDTAQHDIAQHSTAQSTLAQRDASGGSQGASELATHLLDDHDMIQDEPAMSDMMQDWHQPLPAALQSSNTVPAAEQHHGNDQAVKPQLEQQPQQLQQQQLQQQQLPQQPVSNQPHDHPDRHEMISLDLLVSPVHEASAHEPVRQAEEEEVEEEIEEEGLFGEASVLGRGGLRMTDKVTCLQSVDIPVSTIALLESLVHAGCMQTQIHFPVYGLGQSIT